MKPEPAGQKTYYVVQGFTRDRRGIRMDLPLEAGTKGLALRMAERMSERKSAVVVLARTGNPETGEFEEPEVVCSYGEMPDDDLPF
ncbi:hypothetical protein [Methylobacterium sp. NEAU K]|uniref:hypothetical protein n=1 Tax=Methylobacterium sp. NEAU K TaxID=3064946 RepID=UPI0027375C15|nr:hypothetical protein [Methylobacterium sp. NEAU K]MDP4005108.1 hypothetical protein [Methylobacterium sp. NEAU K]